MIKKFKRGQHVMTTFLDDIILEVDCYDTENWVILVPIIGLNNCPIKKFIMVVHEDNIRNIKESDGLLYKLYKN